jgi:hypothetical protein
MQTVEEILEGRGGDRLGWRKRKQLHDMSAPTKFMPHIGVLDTIMCP